MTTDSEEGSKRAWCNKKNIFKKANISLQEYVYSCNWEK